jgi:hypothetical protein
MADALAAMGQAPAASPGQPARPTVYAAGGGRKFAFSFVFLLLLPFFVSLPPMLFWRISQGHWHGTFGLMVLAVAFAFIMFLIVIELMHSLMARIELGDTAVKLTLPAGRGPTPMVRYKTREIPYSDIKAIETRREIYGGSVAPVLLKGARLILKDDTPVKLGYVSEADSDPSFPYPDIAHQIAERAGIAVTDRGNVRRSAQKKFLGLKKTLLAEPEGTVEEAQIAELNASHRRWVMRLILLLVGLVVVGIALDIIFPPSSGLPPELTSFKSLIMRQVAPETPKSR